MATVTICSDFESQSVSCSVMSDSLQLHDCSLPGSSVHGILQARILEWVAISFSRGSSGPRARTQVSHIAGRFFTIRVTREPVTLEPNKKKSVTASNFSPSICHEVMGLEDVILVF